jgi:hypothetical protein
LFSEAYRPSRFLVTERISASRRVEIHDAQTAPFWLVPQGCHGCALMRSAAIDASNASTWNIRHRSVTRIGSYAEVGSSVNIAAWLGVIARWQACGLEVSGERKS